MIQVTTIAPQDATDKIDIPEIECLLSQEEVPAFLRPLFVTIAVRDDDWYPQETYRQKAPERIEDAAKFLSGMISISLTVLLSVDKEAFTAWTDSTVMAVAVVLWLLSLLAAFLVLFPVPFRYNQHSAEDIRRMNDRVVAYKYRWLIGSALSFVVALALVAWVFLRG